VASGSAGTTKVTAVEGESESCVSNNGCNLGTYNGDDTASIFLQIPCSTNCDDDDAILQKSANVRSNAAIQNVTGEAYVGFGSPAMSGGANPCQAAGDALDSSGASLNAYTYFPSNLVSSSNVATMTYDLFGAEATQQSELSNPSSFCYGDTVEFTQLSGAPAPFDATTGQYEGVLPDCSTGDLPCSEYEAYYPSGYYYLNGAYQPEWTIQILAANDPSIGKH
jgi:hypothetical protein